MPTFDSEFRIQIIREKVSIFDVLSRLGIEHQGDSTQQIRCPFHDDSEPSARVYGDTQRIYCFRCQKGWDLFSVVRQKLDLQFPMVLDWIEQEFNVTVDLTPANLVRASLMRKNSKNYLDDARFVEELIISHRDQLDYLQFNKLCYALDLSVWFIQNSKITTVEFDSNIKYIIKSLRKLVN